MTNPQLISYATYPLRSGARQGYLFSPLLCNIILEVLPRTVSQEKERKDIWIERSRLATAAEACAPQEKPLRWEACALQLESSPLAAARGEPAAVRTQHSQREFRFCLKISISKNKTQVSGKVSLTHGLEQLTLLKCPYYPKPSILSV